jgi:tRNA A58 N-methylase Trm61
MIPLGTILVIFFLFLFLVFVISVLIGVPFLPTHRKQANTMIALAELKPGMTVVDLGSGAGRLLFAAAAVGAEAIGYELNPFLVLWTKLMIKVKGLNGQVTVKWQSLYQADLHNVDVVFAFLFPTPMQKLSPKLFSELKPGAKIISYVFAIPDKKPIITKEGILVYQVGENALTK